MKHLKIGNYAFWRYDHPFKPLIGGLITDVSPAKKGQYLHGHVEIEGYGNHAWFNPVFCLPADKGALLKSAIEEEERVYKAKVAKVSADFEAGMRILCAAAGAPDPYKR